MNSACRSLSGAVFVGLLVLAFPGWSRADDVTTLSGQTFRDVRLVRVDPDGVTWEHATGVVKVDFADLPETVRRAYHYDAGKAAAFAASQAQARERFDAQAQQARREAEVRRVEQYQGQGEGRPGEFVLRRKAADPQVQESVDEGIAAKTAAEAFRTKDDGTIWDRRLWAVPKFIFGGNAFDGVAFNPKTDLNAHEFKSSLHSSGADFFNGDYMTKSYYQDVERAEAFARGKP